MEVEPACIAENETEGSRGDRKEGGKRGRKPGRKASDKTDMKAKLARKDDLTVRLADSEVKKKIRKLSGRKRKSVATLTHAFEYDEYQAYESERSRQSARECRARKKLRYQYLEELVTDREKAVLALRKELETYRQWGQELDAGRVPDGLQTMLEEFGSLKREKMVN